MPRRFGERCYTEINSDGVAVCIGRRTYRNTRQVHDLAIPQDGEIVGLGGAVKTAGKVTDGAADLAVYFQDGVPFPQAVGAALGVVGKLGHGGAAQLTACNNQHQQHHKAQHKVHHRTAQRYDKTLPGGSFLKGLVLHNDRKQAAPARLLGGGLRRRRGVFLCVRVLVVLRQGAEQVVAAQREQAQGIGGTSPFALKNFGAETDGKFLDMDAAVAGGKKMPQFMYQNDRPKHEQ